MLPYLLFYFPIQKYSLPLKKISVITLTTFIIVVTLLFIQNINGVYRATLHQNINVLSTSSFLALSFLLIPYSKNIKNILSKLITLTLMSLILFFTKTRGVMLVFLTQTILFPLTTKLSNTKKLLFIFIITSISFIFYSNNKVVKQRINKIDQQISSFKKNNVNTSIGLRLFYWTNSIENLNKNLIFGIGKKGIEKVLRKKNKDLNYNISQNDLPAKHLHSNIIEFWITRGLIGLFILLFMYIFLIRMTYYSFKCNHSYKYISLTVTCCLIVLGFIETVFRMTHSSTLLISMIYMIIGQKQYEESN